MVIKSGPYNDARSHRNQREGEERHGKAHHQPRSGPGLF